MITPPNPLDFLKSLLDIADKTGALEKVKSKLIMQPDPAAEKLDTVLDEILKVYASIQLELPQYLSLWFDPGASKEEFQ